MTFKCIESLEENPTEIYLEVTSILLRLVDNVLHYPSNPKYRKLKLENKLVSSVILPSIGAMECLFEIGFQEGDDALLLPPESTSVEKLTRFRDEISSRRNKFLKGLPNGNSTSRVNENETREPSCSERQSTPQPEAAATSSPQASVNSTNQFLERLQKYSLMVLQYEQEATKRKALSMVPINKISERVQKCMREHQQMALKNNEHINEASLQEALFFNELMKWFKNDFFEWVNCPKCENCKCESKFVEMSSDPKELVHSDRVEVYKCNGCSARILFPRINDVSRLLDTRRGRCGEWANAFTALCRALGYDARYVYDETDHVWTEVYFKSQQRWVHCDSCECALDKPLLYEKGWGKKLTYVIGFSCDGVQDVTWRYSAHHDAVRARRKLCSEEQLVQTICRLNQIRQANFSTAKKKVLARRAVVELVELMIPAKETEGDSQGRRSGSLSWRLARLETTLQQAANTSYVWTPTKLEVEAKKMVISYCTGRDQYFRVGGEMEKGWSSRTFSVEKVFRKEEKDWKAVYLCRTEGSAEGKVSWRVDVSGSGLKVDRVEVKCPSTTFQSGKVSWSLCGGDVCIPVINDDLKTSALRGSTCITLSVTLSGGEGGVAWQHAQLFRQPLDSSEISFQLTVTLAET